MPTAELVEQRVGEKQSFEALPWCGDNKSVRRLLFLIKLCEMLEPRVEVIEQLRELSLNLRLQYSGYNDAQPYQPLVRKLLQSGQEVLEIIRKFNLDFASVPYPFSHATKEASVAQAVIVEHPDPKNPADVHAAAEMTIGRFYDLVYRVLAELADRVERLERGIGLEPLGEPPRGLFRYFGLER